MAAHASSAAPAPVSQRPSRWPQAAVRDDDSQGELANAACVLCGIQLSIISLVPDGGSACADVRWYCRDITSCTERWTASMAQPAPAGQPPAPGEQAQAPAEAARSEQAVPGEAAAGAKAAAGEQAVSG